MSIATEITRLQNAKASIKTSIENKGVTVPSATKLDGYSTLIDSIQTGGGGYTIDQIIERSEITGDVVYEGNKNLQSSLFANTNIKSFTATKNITFGSSCFNSCRELESVSATIANTSGTSNTYVFQNCVKLKNVDLPLLRGVGNSFLRGCTSLETIVLKSLGIMASDVFNGCTKLKTADFSVLNTLQNSAFLGCTVFDTLILRKSTVTTLGHIGAFNNSPFASGKSGGTLYVPQDLITSYQSATNWSTILGYTNNQIKSIESTHTDPTAPIDLTLYYADGTPIS